MSDADGALRKRPTGIGGSIVLVHGLLCLALSGFALSYPSLGFVADALVYPLSITLVGLCVWCLWSWRVITRTLSNPYVIFFLAAALFNGGQALLEIFHLNRDGILGGTFSNATIVDTLLLVIIGLASFHLGALISALVSNHRDKGQLRETGLLSTDLGALRVVGWLLMGVSIVPTLMRLQSQLAVVLASGYSGLYEQAGATGLAAGPDLLAGFLSTAAIFILIGGRGRRLDTYISGGVIGAYAIAELMLGFQAYAIWPVLAWVWAYHRAIRPVSRAIVLAGGAFLMIVVFPLVAVSRNTTGDGRLSLSSLSDKYGSIDNPMVAIISEIGGSMNTVAYTIQLVPRIRPFDHGVGYFYALTTVLPNIFGGELHPAMAHGMVADWLVRTVNPSFAARGGGLGYSFIAEAFLNFGWLGAPVALLLIGTAFGGFFLWADRSRDPLKLALAAIFLSFLTHYARGEAISIVRPLVWYAVLPCLFVVALSAVAGAPRRGASTTSIEKVPLEPGRGSRTS